MKRFAVMILVLCLLLAGCAPSQETPAATDTTPTTQPATDATTEPTTEATEPPALYRHPLTGEVLDAPYTSRPTAVVINNLKKCLPQYGIGAADMIYEVETEGGITRLLAIFSDLSGIKKIGPVRSLRTYFTNISESYDIPAIHCGGSRKARAGMYSFDNKLDEWEHIDQAYNGKYFYRDKDRKAQGYALEHTLFTTGEMLTAALDKKGYNTVYETAVDYGLRFADDVALQGEAAGTVKVTFRGKKTTTLKLDAKTGLYEASQYSKNHVDGGTGDVQAYRNVIVLQTKQKMESDGTYTRSYYDLEGVTAGNGYFACNGKIVPITWKRSKVSDSFSYFLTDGTPVTLGVGKTYVAVIGTSGSAGIAYE